jgi:hypothetical protein
MGIDASYPPTGAASKWSRAFTWPKKGTPTRKASRQRDPSPHPRAFENQVSSIDLPIIDNRLLIVSQFSAAERCVTKTIAAALADETVFAHIAAGGHVEELRRLVVASSIPDCTLGSEQVG